MRIGFRMVDDLDFLESLASDQIGWHGMAVRSMVML